MCKKIVGLVTGIVLASLLFGTDAFSYLTTSASQVTSTVKDAVPIDFEINRARKMVSSLEPEIRRNLHLIAKEEVEVDRIHRQIDNLETRLVKDRTDMVRMTNDLEDGDKYIVYASRRYSRNQVKQDLTNRLTRAKTTDATLDNLSKVLNARERGLGAARQKLEEMLSMKRTLLVEVANLEARHKMNEVAQAASEFAIDNSQLSRVKECVDDLESRIAANERFLNVEGEFHSEIPVNIETEVDEDIMDQVASFLGRGKIQAEVVVVAELDLE